MYSSLRKQERYVENLSNRHKKAVTWYTGGNFDRFNRELRQNRVLSDTHKEKLELIDQIFDIAPPLETPIVVYKGKSSRTVYSDKAFVSTTLDYENTKRFSGENCCVIQITVSPGSKVLPIRTISREPDEEEVLLDRDGILAVTGSTIRKDMKIIFASYMPQESRLVVNETKIDAAEKSFDSDLIVERIIAFFEDEDPDFIDDEEIGIVYKKVTGNDISPQILKRIKTRLKKGK